MKFPHKCPACGDRAYVGLRAVDCSNPTCKHASAETRRSHGCLVHGLIEAFAAIPPSVC